MSLASNLQMGNVPMASDAVPGQMPWSMPENPDPPPAPLSPEDVMRIRRAALRLLAERGVELQGLEGEAGLRRALDAAQLRLEGNVARFDPDFVSEMIALAPAAFRIEPRNPARTITVGGRYMLFGAVASATEIWDLQRGRRSGNLAACEDLLRLAQSFNCIHFLGGYPVEPQDIPPPMRHLVCAEAALRLTDKVIHAYPLGPDAVRDVMTLARLAAGLDEAEFAAKPRLYVNINSAGPLTFDASVLAATLCAARSGQAVMVTPLVMAEAGSGVTVAGMATLALAEALAVVALVQQVRPGTPVILGALSACLGPTFRAPVFGTAESLRMTEALAQIARSLRLPFRATAASTANIADAQAMAETANSLWSGVRSGANMLQHAAGWLSRGTAASAEKFVLDCEQLQLVQRYWQSFPGGTQDENLLSGLPGAGGTGAAFPEPITSDWRPYPVWEEDGALWASERAAKRARRILDAYEPPALDPARAEAMTEFVARRSLECSD